MKLVKIVGDDVSYPTRCACCLQPATGTMPVRKEDLKRLAMAAMVGSDSAILAQRIRSKRATNVPYCGTCMGHMQWSRLGGWVGVALSVVVNAFFAALGGGALYVLLSVAASDDSPAPRPTLVVGACLVIAVAIALSKIRFRPSALDRSHTGAVQEAVEIARFDSGSMVLRCRNDTFARELLQANPGSAETRAA
jgi:hypothetical protein